MIPMFCATGCVNGARDSAACDGTAGLRTDLAAALVDAPNDAVVAGARLIQVIDAGCGKR
jgi:hypothetical protein